MNGFVQGRAASMPVTLELTNNDDAAALPLIWARNRIASLGRDVALGQNSRAANDEITQLGLGFSLQTQNTSFVAVSQTRVNTTDQNARLASVPLPIPSGAPVTAFSGSSTPEPHAILGFLIVAAISMVGLRRRRV